MEIIPPISQRLEEEEGGEIYILPSEICVLDNLFSDYDLDRELQSIACH